MALIKILFCFYSFAMAGIEIIDGPGDLTPTPPAYMLENIKFKKMLLLDKATFDSRQVARLNLATWPENLKSPLWSRDFSKAAMTITKTYEGHIVEIEIQGPAHKIADYFSDLIGTKISSLIHTKGGWVWAVPSETYGKYWSEEGRKIQNDLRTQAYLSWLKDPYVDTNLKASCQLSLVH